MQSATVKWVAGEEFIAKLPSGHSVSFDADRKHNAAPRPLEMLLGALGAWTSVDGVMILAKKRPPPPALGVVITGERASDPRTVWTKIEMVYRLAGALEDKAVGDAIELSQSKYCSVAAMM